MIMTKISKEHCDNCNNEVCCCIIRTQETLEEASNNWEFRSFEAGAKWQQERSYSEEDLKLLLKKFKKDIINSTELDDDFETLVCDIETNKWFEQFKKK